MARPIALVYQEYKELNAVPSTPDLNCLIAGPAYQIQDYPKDSANIGVSDYGSLNTANPYTPPVASTPEITLAAPPNMTTGAWVDPASVRVYFDEARVILTSGADGVTVITAPNENTFTSVSATFLADGVAAGDTLIVDEPGGAGSLVLTVTSVDSETVLRVTRNFEAADTVLGWRIERTVAVQEIDTNFVSVPVYKSSNEIEILGGVTIPVGSVGRVVSHAKVYVAYRAYRTDLQGVDTITSTAEILTKVGRIDARNPLAVGLSVAKQNAGNAPIQFYGVDSNDLIGYAKVKDAISTDDSIYAVVPLISDLPTTAMFKADNVILADPNQALATGVPQKFRVVIGSTKLTTTTTKSEETLTGTAEALTGSSPSVVKTVTLASLTALATNLKPGDKLVLSASENVSPVDGTYTIAHINSDTSVELDEVLPVTVSAAEGVNYTVTRPSTNATLVPLVDNRAQLSVLGVTYYSRVAGTAPGGRTIAKIQDATTAGGIQSIVEVAGVSTIINGDFTSGSITAQHISDALNYGTGVTVPFAGSVNVITTADTPATVQTAAVAVALSTGTGGVDDLTSTAAVDDLYLRLYDAAATFLTDGVLVGDYIEVPSDPNGVYGSTYKRFKVANLISEQRLEIDNILGGVYQTNTSTTEYELPHTDNRLGEGTLVTQGTVRYRVVRHLTTAQQVDTLVSEAQSLNSRRSLLVWPDEVLVASLTDNSKPTNSDGSAAAAGAQPGYYLAAAIGGMTAGLPSHQGFSRLGIAGVSSVNNSSRYFTESQLTELSDGGLYVFKQDTPTSLAYSIHQLTTDPATLESGEFSMVKNFDYVSLFFLGILDPFLGQWNINNDTLGFIRQAVNTGIGNLKLKRVAKIGAPINDATLTSLAVSNASADRVEIYVDIDFPKVLNVIGLHLVG